MLVQNKQHNENCLRTDILQNIFYVLKVLDKVFVLLCKTDIVVMNYEVLDSKTMFPMSKSSIRGLFFVDPSLNSQIKTPFRM